MMPPRRLTGGFKAGPIGKAVPGPPGAEGPQGDPGMDAQVTVHVQSSPAATWTIPNTYARPVHVTLYDDDGVEFDTDVTVTSSFITLTFPAPTTGSVVLS